MRPSPPLRLAGRKTPELAVPAHCLMAHLDVVLGTQRELDPLIEGLWVGLEVGSNEVSAEPEGAHESIPFPAPGGSAT